MAIYKVPQDVEAEDKLIGPFSFRQFIYLIVAALGIFMAWALSRVFVGLLVIPLPVIVVMLALALPLRKDQPMETYLIAMIKFFFKPRRRMWDPEGSVTLVQIAAPKVADGPQLKDVAGDEASRRLDYLSQIVDTQGWASRGVDSATMNDIFIADASKAEDILDDTSDTAQNLEQRIAQNDDARLKTLKQQFQTSAQLQQADPTAATPLQSVFPEPTTPQMTNPGSEPLGQDPQSAVFNPPVQPADPVSSAALSYNPYPSSMHQKVLSPSGNNTSEPVTVTPAPADPPPPTEKTGNDTVSPDIIRLVNNKDLSISTIAREAERLSQDDASEVVISLR